MLEQKHNEEQNADAANSQPAYCKTDVSRSPCLSESDVLQFGLNVTMMGYMMVNVI